jgi:hypothetical protein
MPTTTGIYTVALKNDKVRLPIPHSSVGYVYKAGKIADPPVPKEKRARIEQRVTLKLGEESFTAMRPWHVPMPDKKTDTTLVKLDFRCVEAVVSVQANMVRPGEPPRVTPPPSVSYSPPTGWRIPAGAPLMTSGGREVAVAAKDIGVVMPSPAPNTVCFEARVTMIREDEYYYGGHIYRPTRLCAAGRTCP